MSSIQQRTVVWVIGLFLNVTGDVRLTETQLVSPNFIGFHISRTCISIKLSRSTIHERHKRVTKEQSGGNKAEKLGWTSPASNAPYNLRRRSRSTRKLSQFFQLLDLLHVRIVTHVLTLDPHRSRAYLVITTEYVWPPVLPLFRVMPSYSSYIPSLLWCTEKNYEPSTNPERSLTYRLLLSNTHSRNSAY